MTTTKVLLVAFLVLSLGCLVLIQVAPWLGLFLGVWCVAVVARLSQLTEVRAW